jgi:SAM-dependent methyltransferase
MTSVSENANDRWQKAQIAERIYWDKAVVGGAEFLQITAEKLRCLELVNRHAPEAIQPDYRRPKQVVEIGIGPLAVGVGNLLEPPDAWRLTAVEPQPRRDCEFPEFIMAGFRILARRTLSYVHTKGETTGLPSDNFDLALCFNVIDHTPNWRGILAEICRILKPGGYIVLTVDTLCFASYVRWACILRWLKKSDLNVLAHPSRLTAFRLERYLPRLGLQNLFVERHRGELYRRLFGKARRLTVVAQKPSRI